MGEIFVHLFRLHIIIITMRVLRKISVLSLVTRTILNSFEFVVKFWFQTTILVEYIHQMRMKAEFSAAICLD